jgi:6-phosphofructokinase
MERGGIAADHSGEACLRAAIAHGGGPTAALNASLVGVIDACREHAEVLYGPRFGLGGLLADDVPDLLRIDPETVDAAAQSPGSVIGSSRRRFESDDYARLIDAIRARDIRVLFYAGGNGSMDTALAISRCARSVNYQLQVIGIPKTIDNDLLVTDHSPGYASTAYFFACAARDVGIDNRSLPSPICVLETLGRNTGWVAAATSLARKNEDDAPHLIYLPERRVGIDRIAADVEAVYRRLGRTVIAVCEGQRDESGQPFGAEVDRPESPVHQLASNLGHMLARQLAEKLGVRARAEKPGLLGRSCGPFARERDRREAYECGRAAVRAAAAGEADVMVALWSDSSTFLTPLESVARKERRLPAEWIGEQSNDVTAAFRDYAIPLVGEVDGYGGMW